MNVWAMNVWAMSVADAAHALDRLQRVITRRFTCSAQAVPSRHLLRAELSLVHWV